MTAEFPQSSPEPPPIGAHHVGDGNGSYSGRKQAQIAAFYENLGIDAPRVGYGAAFAAWLARARSGAFTRPDSNPAPGEVERRAQPERTAASEPGNCAYAAPAAATSAETAVGEPAAPLHDYLFADPSDQFPAAPQPAIDEPTNADLRIGDRPGDEGGTLQPDSLDHAQPRSTGPSWWERQKAAVARRRERFAQRPRRSRTERIVRISAKSVGCGLALVYGIGNLTEPLAAAWYGGTTTVADRLVPGTGIMIAGSGTRPVFARPLKAKDDDPNRAHLPEAARGSENYTKTTYMLAALEDRRALASPWSLEGLARVHGTDTLGLARAALTQIAAALQFPVKRRGGSTMPVTTCSIALGSMEMPSAIIATVRAKLAEHGCAALLEAQSRGDARFQAGMLLDNAPLVIGGGLDTQGVTLAAWQLFSKDFAVIDADCHLAVIAAAVNKPFMVPGESLESQENARKRLAEVSERAQTGLAALRRHQGRELGDDDRACTAALPSLLARRYSNPAGDLNRAFGAAAPQIAREAFAYRVQHPGTVQLTARFDAAANEAAMQRVGNTACAIADRKHLLLNICPRNGSIDATQVRVIAVTPDGIVHRMVASGAGASSALSENETGDLPGRGSVGKGILLPVLGDDLFCRYDYPLLVDADGVAGVDHPCRPEELISSAFAVKHSLNQPFLYALENTDQARLARYRDALNLPKQNLRDLVLGNHPAATQILLRDYMAITTPHRIGRLPHFIIEAATNEVDLSAQISSADSARARQLLTAPTQQGGTAHMAVVRLRSAGYTVNWAKSGTSEAGFGTLERGKHLVMELVDPTGKTLIVFAEIASADSTAIAASKVLSSADLADLILASLQSEA